MTAWCLAVRLSTSVPGHRQVSWNAVGHRTHGKQSVLLWPKAGWVSLRPDVLRQLGQSLGAAPRTRSSPPLQRRVHTHTALACVADVRGAHGERAVGAEPTGCIQPRARRMQCDCAACACAARNVRPGTSGGGRRWRARARHRELIAPVRFPEGCLSGPGGNSWRRARTYVDGSWHSAQSVTPTQQRSH